LYPQLAGADNPITIALQCKHFYIFIPNRDADFFNHPSIVLNGEYQQAAPAGKTAPDIQENT